MNYHQVTREELKVCLPKFDPRCDLQLGEWVLVIPHRRSELIEPLIKIVEEKGLEPKYPFLDNCYSFAASSSEALTAANDCLPDLNNKEHFVHPSRVFPSLADSYKKYSRSRKHSRSYGEHGGEVEDETMLYLNYKALILTSSAPSIFGGSDFLEGLDKETNRVVFFNWKTGEVRTDSSALQPNKVPDWAEEVVEKAEEEFSRWRRHHRDVSRVSVKKGLPVRSGLDAPPSR